MKLTFFYSKAAKYVKDHKRLSKIVGKSLLNIGKFSIDKEDRQGLVDDFKISCLLVREWCNGTYRTVPTESVIKITAAILYFIMPIDLIPDFILGTGLLDDITVIAFILGSIKNDIDKYKEYKSKLDTVEKSNETK